MKKLMITAIALAAAFTLTADNYTPSSIPSGLTESDVTPGEVNYQGLLRNPKNGEFYKDGIYDLECRLYTQESGGTPIWGASYSAYVKEGYFNLMLGSSSGSALSGCTYSPDQLWKALWFKTGNRDLYLGVTPRQDSNGAAIISPKEISPRQKLLTAPFAFRAQKAQYADAAPGNFNVGGNLEVAGNVTVASGKKLTLKNISASDSDVKIGTNKTSPSKTTVQGATVTVEAGTALNVNSHGDANVTMDTGKTLNLSGGTLNVVNASSRIKATDSAVVDGGEHLTIGGDEVRGNGKLKWNRNGRDNSATYVAPFVFRTVKFQATISTTSVTVDIGTALGWSNSTVDKYSWAVVGVMDAFRAPCQFHIEKKLTGGCQLSYERQTIDAFTSYTVAVDIMGVLKEFTDDTRR